MAHENQEHRGEEQEARRYERCVNPRASQGRSLGGPGPGLFMSLEYQKQQCTTDEIEADGLHEERESARDASGDEPTPTSYFEPSEESGESEHGEEEVVPGRKWRGIVRQAPRYAQERHSRSSRNPDEP